MRKSNETSGAGGRSFVRGAAVIGMLGLGLGCDPGPGKEDASGDGAEASAGDSDSVGGSSGGPVATSGEGSGEASGNGSYTGVDPTAGSDDESGTTDPTTGGDPTATTGVDPTGDPTGDPTDPCDALEVTCAGFDGSELVVFQMATGAIDDTFPVPFETYEAHSITWVGDHVYACVGMAATLFQIDVGTGAMIDSGQPCTAVADIDGTLLVRRGTMGDPWSTDYATYPDFAAVQAGAPSTVTNYTPDIERITATGDTLISSWHSDDHVAMHDLVTGAWGGDVPLDGYDGWVLGMDVVAGQLIVNTWFSNPLRQVAFDLATGARTCELPSVGGSLDMLDGLACKRGEGSEPPPQPPPA